MPTAMRVITGVRRCSAVGKHASKSAGMAGDDEAAVGIGVADMQNSDRGDDLGGA
jgi:hypothetical protein